MSCTCEEKSLTVSCTHLPCSTPEPINCDANLGLMKVQQIVDCCKHDICGEFTHFYHLHFNILYQNSTEGTYGSKIQTKRQWDIYITKTVYHRYAKSLVSHKHLRYSFVPPYQCYYNHKMLLNQSVIIHIICILVLYYILPQCVISVFVPMRRQLALSDSLYMSKEKAAVQITPVVSVNQQKCIFLHRNV